MSAALSGLSVVSRNIKGTDNREESTMTTTITRPVARQELDGGYSGQITVTRGRAGGPAVNPDLVFVESELTGSLCLTRVQAADLAEILVEVAGMATSTRAARFLAQVTRDQLLREGITRSRVSAVTGISPRRLRQILAAEVPMTHDEHVAISEVQA